MDTLKNLDLLTVGIAAAAMIILGFVLYFSDRTRALNRNFLFFSLSASAWSLVNYISYRITDHYYALYSIRGVLFFATLLAFFMFKLMYSLPGVDINQKKYYRFGIIPVVLVTLLLTLSPFVVKNINNFNSDGTANSFASGLGIFFFGIVISGLFLAGIIMLIRGSIHASTETKKQFRSIFPGFILTIVLLLSFNFYFPAFLNISTFVPYGALFIFPFIAFTFYAIFRHHLFNIKNTATMVIAFALTITTFLEIIYSVGFPQILFRSSVFLLVIIFSIQLIRNIITLEKANAKLKELDQLKSEFVSLATHQIRAPLTAIKGYLSEVFEGDFGPVNPGLDEPLKTVYQSTENLVHIVADFLNISRIDQGTMEYELAPLDLKEVTGDVIKELEPSVARKGLELKFEAPDGNNYEIYADVGKIKEVIGNLIDNAIKYTPKGNITVTLSSNPQTHKVLLAVKDTGIGIPAEVIPKLFQKFTRAKGANEVNIIGTGLGLYVAKMMTEGQHGRVWAKSTGAGQGSTFYVELPVAHVS